MNFHHISKSILSTTALALILATPAVAQENTEAEQPEEARQLDTVVIRGEFIPAPQRETSQVASFLGPEDLARQGDTNAAPSRWTCSRRMSLTVPLSRKPSRFNIPANLAVA